MKKNYGDRRNDSNILEKEVVLKEVNNSKFKGKIVLTQIKEIKDIVCVKRPDGSSSKILDKNYNWMMIFEKEKKYCTTIMYDENWNLIQWYFDIAKDVFQNDKNVPYSEDLLLDVVVLPDGKYYTLDEDELDEAKDKLLITEEEYEMANNTAKTIINMVDKKFQDFCDFTNYCLGEVKNN